jgi:hypothetical protein
LIFSFSAADASDWYRKHSRAEVWLVGAETAGLVLRPGPVNVILSEWGVLAAVVGYPDNCRGSALPGCAADASAAQAS